MYSIVQTPTSIAQTLVSTARELVQTARTLASTARLSIKLVESLLLVISSKLDSSDELKTVLLSGYKVLGDYLWGYDPYYSQGCTWAELLGEA